MLRGLKQLVLIHFFYTFVCMVMMSTAIASTPKTHTSALPGTVALTFDDGPHPLFTPKILDILQRYHIKATFFVVGVYAEQYPDLVKRIKAEGHSIASHSMTHPMLTKLSDSKLQWEITEASKVITQLVGNAPKCLRYPFGESNEHVRAAIRAHEMHPVTIGFDSYDILREGTQKMTQWVLKHALSTQVILLHDGFRQREQTVAALPAIIDGIQKKGLGFSTICS